MATAISLAQFLDHHQTSYQSIPHKHCESSYTSAITAAVPSDAVCKAVLMRDARHEHLLAVVPARHRLDVDKLNRLMRQEYQLASEHEVDTLFSDCSEGAIPALGQAYQIPMVIDDGLLNRPYIYIESGDHEHLLRVEYNDFLKLMTGVKHGAIHGHAVDSHSLAAA